MPLSQYEVDSLMNALSEGWASATRDEIDLASVKRYDFRRPDKLSKDHVNTLQMMHETFARLLSSSLSAYLRIPVHAMFGLVEQTNSDEYLARIEGPTVINLVSLGPANGRVILELSPDVAYAILDRLLGGQGRGLGRAREATDIELALLQSVAAPFLNSLKEAWTNVLALEPRIEEISLNPQFLQGVLPDDTVVIFAFALMIQDTEGSMNIVIPYETLEPVIGKLNAQSLFTSRRTGGAEITEVVRERIARAHVPVRVEVGSATVTLRELSDLQPGDVITLDRFIHEDVDVFVNNEHRFRGRPGTTGSRLAVQITQFIEAPALSDAFATLTTPQLSQTDEVPYGKAS
jgi:flagellar motor switch protein FliM